MFFVLFKQKWISLFSDIIECGSGILYSEIPDNFQPEDHFYIISDKKDNAMCAKLRRHHGSNIKIINTEGFMLAVMQQCIRFERFLMS